MFKSASRDRDCSSSSPQSSNVDVERQDPVGFDLGAFLDFDKPLVQRVQREAADEAAVGADAELAVSRAAESSGSALPGDVRLQFESGLGADLGRVRVFTGADSAQAAKAVGAKAYTTGEDIHFAAGQYQPESEAGLHLLAHEVAHTVQQAGGAAGQRQHKLEVSSSGDALEVEADRVADALVSGSPASVSSAPGGELQREPAEATGAQDAGGGDSLAVIDPALWAKCEGTLQTFDSAEAAAGILELRKSGTAFRDLQTARDLEVELLDAIAQAEALAAGGDQRAVDAQLDAISSLQDRLQISAELVEAQKELYTLLGTAGVMAGLGSMAAAEATLKTNVQTTGDIFGSVATEMDGCLKTIQGSLDGILDIALKEELASLLANVTGPVGEILGKNTVMALVTSWAVNFVGSKAIDQAVDGKASWKAPSLTESAKITHELGTKYLTMIDGMPPIYGAVLSWIGGFKKATGLMTKLNAASAPAFDAINRLEVLATRLLNGDVAQRMTVTNEQIAAFQKTVLPILESAQACADDAANWQTIIDELRAAQAPANARR
jgi:hypothetical protein